MCFVLGVNFGDSSTLMQLVLSFKTWQDTSGVDSCTGKTRDISFIRNIKGMTSLIALDSAMWDVIPLMFLMKEISLVFPVQLSTPEVS